ncbi:hypothetical protein FO440_23420 [Mucilaginibacter corticis]|uniref:Uncharacterized protein n=1 Tax=Mucilaginibacter corticis TaxID=2597670 RepID=A0A556M7L4_9SPHI|nr:hypothetical protein [Mucilaginibacter corticis]TSJ35877.1 hypothetical protein FO440_23420 [Mucilaginibacter corticis]
MDDSFIEMVEANASYQYKVDFVMERFANIEEKIVASEKTDEEKINLLKAVNLLKPMMFKSLRRQLINEMIRANLKAREDEF